METKMQITNTKKTKTEQIFEILDKQGYILDNQTTKIFGGEKLYKVNEYIRIWKKLNSDREFFKDKKVYKKQKGHRCHLVHTGDCNDNGEIWYKVCKEFYKEVKVQK